MNAPHTLNDLETIARIHARAQAEAEALRREAYADFWRGADHLLADAALQARRSADRLLQTLRRHARARQPARHGCESAR
jgi:F0F1-type ATP synthase membrane subunit b/b'